MRVLCHHKSNLGPLAPSLLFEPVTVEENVVGIEWRGPSDFTGEDLLSPKSGGGAALDKAKTFLLEMLRDGPVEQDVIENECKKQPFSYRTAERAKQALGIRSSRKQFGGVVFWELPRDKEQGDGSDSPHIDRQPDLAVYGGREGDAT
jgi:hypothetical protein